VYAGQSLFVVTTPRRVMFYTVHMRVCVLESGLFLKL